MRSEKEIEETLDMLNERKKDRKLPSKTIDAIWSKIGSLKWVLEQSQIL